MYLAIRILSAVLLVSSGATVAVAQSVTPTTPPVDEEAKKKGTMENLAERVEELERKTQAQEKEAPKKPSGVELKWSWKDGLKAEAADHSFSFSLNGRAHLDWAWIDENDDLEDDISSGSDQEDGVRFRRVRLSLTGTMYERFEYAFQPEFANNDTTDPVEFKDVYLGVKKLGPLAALRIGHMKEPFGLEELTSSNYITFIERSLTTPFIPAHNNGIAAFGTFAEEQVTWGLGVFKDTGLRGSRSTDGEYAVTGRITGLPMYDEEGLLLHVGLDITRRSPIDNSVAFSSRPETRLADNFASVTLTGDCKSDLRYGPELALTYGSFCVQGEFYRADIDRDEGNDDASFTAYYIMGSYFLTGEKRPYAKATGTFGRVKPKQNLFGPEGGFGAVELTLRYSFLDLEESNNGADLTPGGELMDITFGVNWYLNPNVRIMLNAIRASVEEEGTTDDEGKANILTMRFQFDF